MTLRIVFMGTPSFAVPTLERLLKEHTIVAVYSQPPKPVGRGHKITASPVQQCAETHAIPVFTPSTLRTLEPQEIFRAHQADIAVVVAYGKILPKEILDAPRFGCLNVHGSILPRWRGAAPMQSAILAGDTQTGITIMCMDEGLDTGDMLSTAVVPITDQTTIATLHDDLSVLGADLLATTLNDFVAGRVKRIPQPEEGMTHSAKLHKDNGLISWARSAQEIDRQIRALNPWPGTFFYYNNEVIKVFKASLVAEVKASIGTVVESGERLVVACESGALSIEILQKPGSKAMDAASFLRGYSIPVGTVFSCPDML